MKKDRYSKRHNNWKNNEGGRKEYRENSKGYAASKPVFRPTIQSVTQEMIKENEMAIKHFKEEQNHVCAICGKPISEITTAITDSEAEKVMHFDCVVESLQKQESLGPNDKIAYIGQGRFGVIYYENIHDTKHFKIKKIIDFESKEKKLPWREEMVDLYSKVR